MDNKELKNIFGSIPLKYNFCNEFSFKELTISMRQKDDKEYFNMLNRIRIGTPNQTDIDLLKKQIIPNIVKNDSILNSVLNYIELSKQHKNLICLFPKVDQVEAFNKLTNEKLKIKTINIPANDYIPNSKRNNYQINSKNSLKNLKFLKQLVYLII